MKGIDEKKEILGDIRIIQWFRMDDVMGWVCQKCQSGNLDIWEKCAHCGAIKKI